MAAGKRLKLREKCGTMGKKCMFTGRRCDQIYYRKRFNNIADLARQIVARVQGEI